MIITLCSTFRNAERYLDRYFKQVAGLRGYLAARGDLVRLVLGEGDSTDGTLPLLVAGLVRSETEWVMVDVSHGGPHYGPVVNAQRFKQLAYIANKVLAAVPTDSDAVIWIESDLIWDAPTVVALIDRLVAYPCVAPMILDAPPESAFYDTYAFRKNGINFVKGWPYHAALPHAKPGPIEMDSVGSCVVMRPQIAQRFTIPEEDVIVGFCHQIRQAGGSVWLDPRLTVHHP